MLRAWKNTTVPQFRIHNIRILLQEVKKIMKLSGQQVSLNPYEGNPHPRTSRERFRYRNLLDFTLTFVNYIAAGIFKLQKKQSSGNVILSFHVGSS